MMHASSPRPGRTRSHRVGRTRFYRPGRTPCAGTHPSTGRSASNRSTPCIFIVVPAVFLTIASSAPTLAAQDGTDDTDAPPRAEARAEDGAEVRSRARSAVREAREAAREAMEAAREAMADARDALSEVERDFPGAQEALAGTPRVRLGVVVGLDGPTMDGAAGRDAVDADGDGDDDSGGAVAGVYVAEVPDGSPAGRAGVRAGDVIVSLDERSLLEPLDVERERALESNEGSPAVQRLLAILEAYTPGDSVSVGYVRDGEPGRVEVELGAARPRDPIRRGRGRAPIVLPPRAPSFEDLRLRLRDVPGWGGRQRCVEMGMAPFAGFDRCVAGLEVEDLNPELGRYFGVESGVLVLDVHPESSLGLQAGDVIQAVGAREVEDVEDLRRVLGSYEEGEDVSFRVRRSGEESALRATVP